MLHNARADYPGFAQEFTPHAKNFMAQYYEGNGLYNKALAEYNYCLELNGRITAEYRNRGKILKQLVMPEEVVAEIEKRVKKIGGKG